MNLKVEYLGEIEVIFEMALGNESGNQVGSIHEKNRVRKSRETIPLTVWKNSLTLVISRRKFLNFSDFRVEVLSLYIVTQSEQDCFFLLSK
jgi:hypothetical protein